MTAEERKAYNKAYHKANKEKRKAYDKLYNETHKDEIKAYYQKNKEKMKTYIKAYNQTPAGKKSHRISNWKQKGVICEDFDALYEYYINTSFCEECEVALTIDKVPSPTTRCLDHDHETGLFRNVLCQACNIRRG